MGTLEKKENGRKRNVTIGIIIIIKKKQLLDTILSYNCLIIIYL
jgi:hypothetical protein